MTDETVNEDVQEEAQAEASAPGGLTIQDLRVLKQCVEVASQRGGFQAGEMSTVGNTYNRLAMFIATIDAQNQPEDGENETAEETAEE